jgi:hypothetical protein
MKPLSDTSFAAARRVAVANFLLAIISMSASESLSAESVEFNRDIRPLLAKHCFACHGFDSKSREGDLRLDQRDAAIKAEAIVPNSPDKSELIARIESDDPEEIMPPTDTGDALAKEEIARLRQWIAEGA